MKKGFQGLKLRLTNIETTLKELEEEHKIKLPLLYNQFVSWFDVGEQLFIIDKYYVNSYNDFYYNSYQKYPTEIDFELDNFLSIENVFDHWKNRVGYSDEDYENGYLRIATINRGGAIFVGTKGSDLEKIIVNIWDFDPCYFELANNIMDFVKRIEIAPVPEEDLINGITYSQLYKNWGEDFWRVREDPPQKPLES